MDLWAFYREDHIHLDKIKVEKASRGSGIGTKIMKELQALAREMGLAITLSPEADPGKKTALLKWYKTLGFKRNHNSAWTAVLAWEPK